MSGYRFPRRCMTAFLVVLSLLFSQLALASYVCPGAADAASTAGMAMVPGEPCEGMDSAQPVLCHQHAADMSLSFEPVKAATPSLPAIVQVLAVPLVLAALAEPLPRQALPERQHSPPDPVFLATLRLRV
ncbi:hypothetical protein EH244_25000 [Variovorax beijingensis]|uniref:Copper resistance protein n=2 Tax=Variovorax beijingensis TaxID=2496117 RepID=A0A3P3EDE9_9BURK|nr:hypothetical protein EH244_25000 [Variovorax beijingensis]